MIRLACREGIIMENSEQQPGRAERGNDDAGKEHKVHRRYTLTLTILRIVKAPSTIPTAPA